MNIYSFKKAERPDYVITIEPDYDTDYGEWNGGVYCPEKEYAHGFKQKTDAWCSGGGECTGLNGIGKIRDVVGNSFHIPTEDTFFQSLCVPFLAKTTTYQRLGSTRGLLVIGTMNGYARPKGS